MLTFTIFSSERTSDSLTDTESEGKSGSISDDHGAGVRGPDGKHNNHGEITGMIPYQFMLSVLLWFFPSTFICTCKVIMMHRS